ncbi:MAG: hypothetical protein V4543_03275 [Bacteroidota bacterium]
MKNRAGSSAKAPVSNAFQVENSYRLSAEYRKYADSLIKYSYLDFYSDTITARVSAIIVSVNGIKTAFLPDTSLIYRYVAHGNMWMLADSISSYWPIGDASVMDVDNNGINDIVLYTTYNVHGIHYPYVLLGNANGSYTYRDEITLPNIFSMDKGFIGSCLWGGAPSPVTKEKYKWCSDSLRLVSGAEIIYKENPAQPDSFIADVKLYRLKAGKKQVYKRCNCAEAYDTAVWPGECPGF